jgi:hypothetical protein
VAFGGFEGEDALGGEGDWGDFMSRCVLLVGEKTFVGETRLSSFGGGFGGNASLGEPGTS